MKKKLKFIILTIFIIASILAILFSLYIKRVDMPTSHVFVCDNPKHHSDFDNWLSYDLKIDWVPNYIIINNSKVIGAIKGDISEKEFTYKVNNLLSFNYEYSDLPDFKINNLNSEYKTLKDIMNNSGFYILEISWLGCKDCEHQDKYYTKSIYAKYSTNSIYRYYINSEYNDVKKLYD